MSESGDLPISRNELDGEHEYKAHELWDEAPDPGTVDSLWGEMPDDVTGYRWSVHFGKRVIEDARPPDLDMVQETLLRGEPQHWDDNSIPVVREIDGVDITVLISLADGFVPQLVTAYPTVVNKTEALSSDRFDETEIMHALAATLLDTLDPLDGKWKAISFDEPLDTYGNHRVTTLTGATYVRCVNCGKQFIGKGQLKEQRCTELPQ